MDADDLLLALETEGATVALAGRRLQIRGRVSPALAEQARELRGALLALVRRRRLDDIVASKRRLSEATRDIERGNDDTFAAGARWVEAGRAYHRGDTADNSELLAAERAAVETWAAIAERQR